MTVQSSLTEHRDISQTSTADLPVVLWLFDQVKALQGKGGYKVWQEIDRKSLEKDIQNGLQYKIVKNKEIVCVFSIQLSDPFIWREKDQNDALYLHRIVVNQKYKGEKQFGKILEWAKQYALTSGLKYLRMDTWADNQQLINYYKSFGFVFIENYKTADLLELPAQNRDLEVALLELKLTAEK